MPVDGRGLGSRKECILSPIRKTVEKNTANVVNMSHICSVAESVDLVNTIRIRFQAREVLPLLNFSKTKRAKIKTCKTNKKETNTKAHC